MSLGKVLDSSLFLSIELQDGKWAVQQTEFYKMQKDHVSNHLKGRSWPRNAQRGKF